MAEQEQLVGAELDQPLTNFPLNSRKLTGSYARAIARALGLPTDATREDTLLMIVGKVEEGGRQQNNIQVEVDDRKVYLHDAEGVFLEAELDQNETDALPLGVEAGSLSIQGSQVSLTSTGPTTQELQQEIQQQREEVERLQREVERQRQEIEKHKAKTRQLWSRNCQLLAVIEGKEEEISTLREQGSTSQPPTGKHNPESPLSADRIQHESMAITANVKSRKGRAPPVEPFSGEDKEITFDDWLPGLERAALWNGWTNAELLLQMAGHLRGRALQEWNLLQPQKKEEYKGAVQALKERLDTGSRTLAAQDFRHLHQQREESVADFLRRLERTFCIAYGTDPMTTETREMLLYGQLQEGLREEIVRSPAVTGASTYMQLCLAAKNEENRRAELERRKQYRRSDTTQKNQKEDQYVTPQHPRQQQNRSQGQQATRSQQRQQPQKACYTCGKAGHLARDCRMEGSESKGQPKPMTSYQSKQVTSQPPPEPLPREPDPIAYLLSDSDESDVRQVTVPDRGSQTKCAKVLLQGVPVYGILDSGSDITIVGGSLFKKVATAAKLRKSQFQKSSKTPYTYDGKPFDLHGQMQLDLTFHDTTMRTTVFIKMDAVDQLLLSEGVCNQLGIIKYHPSVEVWRGKDQPPEQPGTTGTPNSVKVPSVRVKLIHAVRILPRQVTTAHVCVGEEGKHKDLLLELDSEPVLIHPDGDGRATLSLTNATGFTQRLLSGTDLGTAEEIETMEGVQQLPLTVATIRGVTSLTSEIAAPKRQEQLGQILDQALSHLPSDQMTAIRSLVLDMHHAFALGDSERGETMLTEFNIETGEATPRRQPARRIPYAVRDEVERQLRAMQDAQVIQPSSSPWASPIVLVRKKDGSMRFCVDYRGLNAVTKKDTFPLPRIDDLLDQLGRAQYFTTLDLAAGYWQIPMAPEAQEKTAFTTHRGLYEFRVMPFGLTNAPAVFQRLMQRILMPLNPEGESDFVSVYVDDVIVFSPTLEDHLEHLRTVMTSIAEAGLKLKPTKCHFACQEIEYLGHQVTPKGLRPTDHHVAAVKGFQTPTNLKELRQFLGLASYYRRFIRGFAALAQPLHYLTRKEVPFIWTSACENAFHALKESLTKAPVLAYPEFSRDFILETDASILGLGAVLSQQQEDGDTHPVAYASRSLAPAEKNYSITELETLAVVWAFSHFRAHLYGHHVTVFTDHSAVKSILEPPNPTGKHARWWTKVYGSGVQSVNIRHRSGKENTNADALSRQPQSGVSAMEDTTKEYQVGSVKVTALSTTTPEGAPQEISQLLEGEGDPLTPGPTSITEAVSPSLSTDTMAEEQKKDPTLIPLLDHLNTGCLPTDPEEARRLSVKALNFTVVDGILYHLSPKRRKVKLTVVPSHMKTTILQLYHGGRMSGHFAGARLYKSIVQDWWWEGLYKDAMSYASNCPHCAIVGGKSQVNRPPLHPIPVQRPFQIWGVDVMELPRTKNGNRYALVFQDFFTKWPMVFPIPDQKTIRIVRALTEEIVPLFGVPEALLSDRGANLLSHLMMDVCALLGIQKLNTTAYHPQCNGMVERFNRTLKGMLRTHATKFGSQWDRYLAGVLYAYRNTPHESTGEKPSFLLFGLDCRTPAEASLLPSTAVVPTDIDDYREELIFSLSQARAMAASQIQVAQKKYKRDYDHHAKTQDVRLGDWILIRFPHEETGAKRKLSRPWHGPYRITSIEQPDVTAIKVYFPQEEAIRVHMSRVRKAPKEFPAGFYWYGGQRMNHGKYPSWLDDISSDDNNVDPQPHSRYCLRSKRPGNTTARDELSSKGGMM